MKTKMTDNFSTDAMLVMIGLCELMTKHGIKPSLSKSHWSHEKVYVKFGFRMLLITVTFF